MTNGSFDEQLRLLLRQWYSQSVRFANIGRRIIRHLVRGGFLDTDVEVFLNHLEQNERIPEAILRDLPFPIKLHYLGLGTKLGIKAIFEDPVYNFDQCVEELPTRIPFSGEMSRVQQERRLRHDLDGLIDYMLDVSEALINGNPDNLELFPNLPIEVERHVDKMGQWAVIYDARTQIPQVEEYPSGDFLLTQDPNWQPHPCWRILYHIHAALIQLLTERSYPVLPEVADTAPTEFAALLSNDPALNIADYGGEPENMPMAVGWHFYSEMYGHYENLYSSFPGDHRDMTEEDRRLSRELGRANLNVRILPDLVDFVIRFSGAG